MATITSQSAIANFAPGVQFSGAMWRVTVNNSLRRRLQASICSVFDPLCENMTSSRKQEVHNLLHYCLTRIKAWQQQVHTENFLKFGHVVFEICERTDRPTDIQTRSSQLIIVCTTLELLNIIPL